jgi:tRNA dimethylallyltransferase
MNPAARHFDPRFDAYARATMLPEPFTGSLILTGPTGAGKTGLALELAQHLNAEIVSMDSMALYRGMDIGTAKPTLEERQRVPHHLIDVLEPWESASVAWWLEQAARCCRQIRERGKRMLIVGGTPLYLKSLLCGLFDGPSANEQVRARLAEEAAATGGASILHQRLATVDPVTARRLHANDVRRVIRALEVWELTGRPISAWQQQWPQATTDTLPLVEQAPSCLWLSLPRAELYERINARVEQMFATGLVEEVRCLRAGPRSLSREAAQALGYKEVARYFAGELTLPETVTLVQTRSRNFAKRQITWFRRLPGCLPATRELTLRLWGKTMVEELGIKSGES